MAGDQVNVVANVIAGTTAGVVSGLLVSFTLWAINHFSKPKFEYFEVGPDLGHFFNNRYRPVIIGGSFVLGHGPALIERNARANVGGIFMGPMGDQVFATGAQPQHQPGSLAGESIEISYRRVSWRYVWSSKVRNMAYKYEMDPLNLHSTGDTGRKQFWWQRNRSDSEFKASVGGWKLKLIVLKPSQTRSS